MANTVTIDERDGEVILHVKYGESICSDCHTRQLVDSLNKELDAWRKKTSALEDELDVLIKERDAADKCINEIWRNYEDIELSPVDFSRKTGNIINAYREKKGGEK